MCNVQHTSTSRDGFQKLNWNTPYRAWSNLHRAQDFCLPGSEENTSETIGEGGGRREGEERKSESTGETGGETGGERRERGGRREGGKEGNGETQTKEERRGEQKRRREKEHSEGKEREERERNRDGKVEENGRGDCLQVQKSQSYLELAAHHSHSRKQLSSNVLGSLQMVTCR